MKTITTISELMAELESGEYNYYGLRGATEHDVEVADRGYLDCSYDADDDVVVGDLNGTCGLNVHEYNSESELMERYNRALKIYAWKTKTVYLIADKNCEYGVDEDEVILGGNGYGADVVAIVKL